MTINFTDGTPIKVGDLVRRGKGKTLWRVTLVDTIDDPDATPDLGERQRVTLLEQARDLADLGCLLPEIAYRLGKDEKVLRNYLRSRDLELVDRIHVDLNEMDAPRGQAITLDRRRRAA